MPDNPLTIGDVPYRERGRIGAKTLADLLRTVDPQEYRRSRAAGEWDDYVAAVMSAIESYAHSLIDNQGEEPTIAWRRAIALHVYEREGD